jgi:hypothetical protein
MSKILKIFIFWIITSCSPLRVGRCFGGKCRSHSQGRRISQSRNQRDESGKLSGYEEFCLPDSVTVLQEMRNFSELLWNPNVRYPEEFYHPGLTGVSE